MGEYLGRLARTGSSQQQCVDAFYPKKNEDGERSGNSSTLPVFPSWSVLAGEVEESADDIVVRIELPGMEKQDCSVTIDGSMLYLKGEKRVERTTGDSTYHVTERAYGVFQRAIPLPRSVDPDRTEATYRNGVLTIRLPKLDSGKGRVIPVA
jgi:HSP20 family protein